MKAPVKLPRPPTTTTMKLSIRMKLPMDGDSAISGAAIVPDRPARPAPMATTAALTRSVSTPCIPVVTGSTDEART